MTRREEKALNRYLLGYVEDRVMQLDLFIPPLVNDKEYFMAKASLDLMNLSKSHQERYEREYCEYRVILYEFQHFQNKFGN